MSGNVAGVDKARTTLGVRAQPGSRLRASITSQTYSCVACMPSGELALDDKARDTLSNTDGRHDGVSVGRQCWPGVYRA